MHDGFTKKIELFANVAIIVVAIVLTTVLVKKFVLTDSEAAKIPKENISVGGNVNLPEVDWSRNGQTLLLVLSTDCRYCHESLPFYQKISKQIAEGAKAKLIRSFSAGGRGDGRSVSKIELSDGEPRLSSQSAEQQRRR